jgi:hypothetical protein
MDELFKNDILYFLPREGEFDVQRVAAAIGEIGFAFQDEAEPSMFVVCPDEECRQKFSEARKSHPSSGYPMMLLISVHSSKIYINQFAGRDFFDYSRQFMEWLFANYQVQVTDESGNDLSDLVTSESSGEH